MTNSGLIIESLQAAITEARSEGITKTAAGMNLVLAATEAVGMLKAYGEVNMHQIMYDLARVAGAAGWCPDDFDQRARDAR